MLESSLRHGRSSSPDSCTMSLSLLQHTHQKSLRMFMNTNWASVDWLRFRMEYLCMNPLRHTHSFPFGTQQTSLRFSRYLFPLITPSVLSSSPDKHTRIRQLSPQFSTIFSSPFGTTSRPETKRFSASSDARHDVLPQIPPPPTIRGASSYND